MYLALKSLHTILALLTISGFVVRGIWMFTGSTLRQHKVTRIAPHIVDTLFLVSGIALIVEINLAVMQNPWMLAKLLGLVAYVGLGMIAMRFGCSEQMRLTAFVAAIATFAYIVGVALSKSPASWLAYLA